MKTLILLAALATAVCAQDVRRPSSFIVNAVNTTGSRYPYYVSLRYTNSTGVYRPFCGGTLIGDRLVLTAAHCALRSTLVRNYLEPLPGDLRQLGLSLNAFPNTYIVTNTTIRIAAFIGASSRANEGSGNPIKAWFVHPWYDPTNLYYDMAVALLANPVNGTQVKLYNPPGDVYTQLSRSANITAVGLGAIQDETYAEIQESINPYFIDQNNSTSRQLGEATIGTLVDRNLCGKALTAYSHVNTSSGSGNTRYAYSAGQTARIISSGQLCVGSADNPAIDEYIRRQAESIANSLNQLSAGSKTYQQQSSVNASTSSEISNYIPGYNTTCRGDSGGPVLIKGADSSEDVQIGTVSFGASCGSRLPRVYNSVQAFLNSTTFDSFLLDVLKAVPNRNGQFMSNLVLAAPSVQSAG